ncbi:type II toxin-antitoxin system RelE/ParE family toxin [Nocardia iowensis]|uniref:Type II toxin-antitoxin system RelE/ParE family toxin n=1 Tax=Nocardia iowensis TaxID=204891 RepID=A0ABX8RY28_NOCIO|nr:type II toxin-antitoxin system RelE/ParE family toxin [Nocardia iowensis]QXN94553.1 type II toxin-antitoxin system RelE/ParE family toxin [Nocardia iowensis]
MIQSFKDGEAQKLWTERSAPKLGQLQTVALRKLTMLDAAAQLNDLRAPPANRLEKLRGDREGQHSIRINDKWRICFAWEAAGPRDVEIVDYH